MTFLGLKYLFCHLFLFYLFWIKVPDFTTVFRIKLLLVLVRFVYETASMQNIHDKLKKIKVISDSLSP